MKQTEKISAKPRFSIGNPFRSVGMRISMVLIASTLVFVFAVGLTSYKIAADVIKRKVAESNQTAIGQAAGKLDMIFRGHEELSMQLFLDAEVQTLLATIKDPKADDYLRFDYGTKLDKKMQSMLLSNSDIGAIHFESAKGEPLFSTSSGLNPELKKQSWYKTVTDSNGKLVWLGTSAKGYGSMTSPPRYALGRVMKNINTGVSEYLMVIEFNSKLLDQEMTELKGSSAGSVNLISEFQKIQASSNPKEILNVAKVQLTEEQMKAGEGNFTDQGTKQLVVYEKLSSAPWLVMSEVPEEELVKDTRYIWNYTLLIALIAAVVACLIGYIMARRIGGPLVEMRNLMQAGEQGNLTVRTNMKRKDEIGELGTSFNQMMIKITQLVQQTNKSAQEVLMTAQELSNASKTTAVSAREISVATEEIANGATSLAVEAERGNDITYSIGSQMQQVMDSNERMVKSAGEVRGNSETGTGYMGDLITKTNATEQMTRSMIDKVENLKTSTQSIRKILDVLNNMTKQTNILSLNATIEASRAGAAGKGFMVVADEIRNLADQTKQSIDVVGQITETIQKEMNETVLLLSEAYPMFQEQIQSVKEADQIFRTVNGQMSEFISTLGNATDSIEALNQTQHVLTEAMTNVSAVAQQSSATSEEVASLSIEQLNIGEGLVRLSHQLENVSSELKETLNKFRTE
ncbi:hypothetical protein SY83_14155 [Paenibacillus swuensis]|uniref:Chemotaxis protein n=1 Tax=Paenibacillus swuensis TaxID=1178515 RepID=A0A172TJH9_9BACL|nr:methyl-accepting chemotaxis protein [Paenibacillus swuensis]ANE47219.1 hypothetical protein SY83_14155 [Paenibacillus swuensis]